MTFVENWFPAASQNALGELAASTVDVDGAVVEVGCWEGRSTIALANAVHPRVVYAVDTWAGSPGEISADLAAERDVRAAFDRNIAAETEGNVVVFQQGWRDFFAWFRDPIAFLHIDAEHTYREVFDNINAALPLLAPGGVICGDDVHHPPVFTAAIEALGRPPAVMATLWWWRKEID